ncbi:RDD family protein [Brachybacterium sp. DNPG3]
MSALSGTASPGTASLSSASPGPAGAASPYAAPGPLSADRDAVVTGEAVRLDLRSASFAVRMLSAAIDGAVQLLILIGGLVATAWLSARGLDDGMASALAVLVSVAAFVGYPVLCEVLGRGRSLGRLALGTRVVRDDGGPVHVRQSLLRAVMAMFEVWSTAGALALALSVLDSRSRRLGDMLAGTMVIQERMRDRIPAPIEVPPSLREWADGADVGRLPTDLVQDIRSFLPRASSINPVSRRVLTRDLVQRTLPHVNPGPPPGSDLEEFLGAVVAERSRRDEARLRRARERQRELAAEVRTAPFRA